jgi:hypothetical protein
MTATDAAATIPASFMKTSLRAIDLERMPRDIDEFAL